MLHSDKDSSAGNRDKRAAEGVGPVIINLERGMVRKLLKRAKRWQLIADEVTPLREPKTIGRALSPDQNVQALRDCADAARLGNCVLGCCPCSQHHHAWL